MSGRDWSPRNEAAYASEAAQRLDADQLALFAGVRGIVLDCDGILTDGSLIYGPDGEALKTFNAQDGLGLVMARAGGVKLALLTGRDSAVAGRRAAELKFHAIKLGRFDKQRALLEILDECDLNPDQVLYMGDDLIDLPALTMVGLPVTVPEAPADVRAKCRYVTAASGGHGAVREITDLVLMSAGKFGDALTTIADKARLPSEGTS